MSIDTEMISANEIKEYIGRNEVQFIDLRDESDYNIGHIMGAIHLPYDEFEKKYTILPKKKEYILYCERGGSSLMAAKIMRRAGYTAKSLNGGMHAVEYRRTF